MNITIVKPVHRLLLWHQSFLIFTPKTLGSGSYSSPIGLKDLRSCRSAYILLLIPPKHYNRRDDTFPWNFKTWRSLLIVRCVCRHCILFFSNQVCHTEVKRLDAWCTIYLAPSQSSSAADSPVLFTLHRLIRFLNFSNHFLLIWKLPFSSLSDFA
jgi:hypothetical protein